MSTEGTPNAGIGQSFDRHKTPYEIFKFDPEKGLLQLGKTTGRERAVDLTNRLAATIPGDYFVIDATTGKLTSTVSV